MVVNETEKEVDYEEYVENLINISRLTTKDNSILFNLKIVQDSCLSEVILIEHKGINKQLKNDVFKCDDDFYKEFIEELIVKFYKNNDIILDDYIDMNEDNKYTYRMITENNDLLSVDGISKEYAKALSELISSCKNEYKGKEFIKVSDERGIGNNVIFIIIIVCMIVVGLIYLLFFK